ncbi:MAG TPA: bifunctional DNA primase/polymerase [Dongiaceae bacterium]|jgi:hypothetical protein
MNPALEAALDYAARGWPVFPCGADKKPRTAHGFHDATVDDAAIRSWPWEGALVAIATGQPSGIVALDVDIRDSGSGLDSLEMLGINFHPQTMTAHTPSGGIHCLFAWPGHEVANSAGKIGPYLDVRGDGGYIVVPPGPRRFWDPHLGLDTPLAPMPEWMIERAPEPVPRPMAPRPERAMSRYCAVAVENAYRAIRDAPNGQQEATFNRAAFSLGQLVEGHGLPSSYAIDVLRLAASKMPCYDARRPWHAKELERKIANAFVAGMRQPREVRRG